MYVFTLHRTARTWRGVCCGRKFENKNTDMKLILQNYKDSPSHSWSLAPGIVRGWFIFFFFLGGGGRIFQRPAQSQSWRTAPCMLSATVYSVSYLPKWMDRDSSVGIAIRYGLDGPGIESRWGGEIFRTRSDRPWGPPSLLYNRYRVFPGGKAAGAWRWAPNPQCRS